MTFIHGSGSQSRKEYAFHARKLAREGMASFAYDKRGSGKSEGNTYDVGYEGYAQDAIAGIQKIKSLYDFEKLGLFAVSEGEWVSLIIDSLINIDFMVMISPSGTTPMNQTIREMTTRLGVKNISADAIIEAEELYHEILSFDNDSISRLELERQIQLSKDKDWFQAAEDFSEDLYFYPWWYKVKDFDPSPLLRKSNTPILVMVGKDNESYPSIETESNFLPYSQVRTVVFEEGDHALLVWRLGKGIPPPAFVDRYEETYSQWIQKQCDDS
ncbi:alpha/beta hydrolase [Portibacter marinus]|uniref:alpha/beta hydrolase n=1 Tax=Portibacter marinus TaxID=2898660 RepID=UPI001F358DD9|nr:alpha/beta hydrolase [Portibacter marinus]